MAKAESVGQHPVRERLRRTAAGIASAVTFATVGIYPTAPEMQGPAVTIEATNGHQTVQRRGDPVVLYEQAAYLTEEVSLKKPNKEKEVNHQNREEASMGIRALIDRLGEQNSQVL